MIKQAIRKLADGENLSYGEAAQAMREMMTGEAAPEQTAGYLVALRMKGETVEEIAASAEVMREVALSNGISSDSMDIVGTGGDNSDSFNISTCAAFIVAAGGVRVAKHGNRSVSSKCGAADVLEALGANTKMPPEIAREVFESCGFVFLHAQIYHPAMRYAAPVRAQLGIRTVFNILGPLANPARAKMQLLGVYSRQLLRPMAEVLARLDTKRLVAVCGGDGLDEVTLSGKTYCCEIIDGTVREYSLTPEDFGLPVRDKTELVGGEPRENAAILRRVLDGERGAYRDATVANAALALTIAGKAENVGQGALLAAKLIDDGSAARVLEKFVKGSNV